MQIEHVPLSDIHPAAYNPRTVSPEQLDQICRSIVEFGLVDPLVARREDGLLIGGHQRLKAIQRLLAGEHRQKDENGKLVPVEWQLPKGGVPVVFVEGMSDERAKMLNLALNRISGDWDHDALADVFKDLEAAGMSSDSLALTGFSAAEVVDYLDLAAEVEAVVPGEQFADEPLPGPIGQRVATLGVDFSSPALRGAVKAHLTQAGTPGEHLGDTLARLLNVTAPEKKTPQRKVKA